METIVKNRTCNYLSIFNKALKLYRNRKEIKFPKNTKIENTYIWRYLQNFIKYIDDNNLDDAVAEKMIYALIEYSAKNNELSKGIALLAKSDMLDILCKKLENDEKNDDIIINSIIRSKAFVESQNEPLYNKINGGSFTNITRWYESGRLSKYYISISKKCINTLLSLDNIERSIFPSNLEMFKIRVAITINGGLLSNVKSILNNDLIEVNL